MSDYVFVKIHKTITQVILLVVLVTTVTLLQTQCNDTCTDRYTIIPVPIPRDGCDGIQGVPGRT